MPGKGDEWHVKQALREWNNNHGVSGVLVVLRFCLMMLLREVNLEMTVEGDVV
jgi:hypothetical protein